MRPHELIAHGITWYDSVRPTEDELRVLQRKYHFHELDVEDCLSEHERPKLEIYDNYLFIVFHIPYSSGGRVLKAELNVFIGKNFIVTVHMGVLENLATLRQQITRSEKKQKEFLEKGPGFFLYKLMEQLFEGGFPIVENISKRLRKVEDSLFAQEEGREVFRDVLTIKRNIIVMRSIILPQRSLVGSLQHHGVQFLGENLQLYFDDLLDAIERQWSLLDSAKELSEALHDTQESWLTFKTNAVVRALTVFSVTLLPVNILIGLYGMNVPIPYQQSQVAFWFILGGIGTLFSGILLYAAYKRWL